MAAQEAVAGKVPVDSVEEAEQTLAAPAELAAQKREQRLRKFRELHLKRNEARKLNHQKLWRKIKDLNYLQSGRLKKLVWNGSCRKKKRKNGEEFYPTSNSLLHGTHVPSTEEIDRMVIDWEKQIEK
ncbi:pre-mRNA-splicing factor SYF2-like [Ursus maritimus]|uniref:Pre-mRNA-splicing factor SYF2 n=1 Tax=Ursus maritimus TaxID=29073 RepID=A0A8M1EZ03_URSMA|nr:pre-mRNA-splicing factor SYF2-like [Ursus maritimus]